MNLQDILAETGFIQPADAPSLPTFKNWSVHGGIYVDDRMFCREILAPARKIDAVTYTANPDFVCRLRIKRLLACRMQGVYSGDAELRHAKNVHSKLYLVTDDNRFTYAWIGSMNLVTPGGWHNLMIRAHRDQTETFRQYFEKLWNLSIVYKHD